MKEFTVLLSCPERTTESELEAFLEGVCEQRGVFVLLVEEN